MSLGMKNIVSGNEIPVQPYVSKTCFQFFSSARWLESLRHLVDLHESRTIVGFVISHMCIPPL